MKNKITKLEFCYYLPILLLALKTWLFISTIISTTTFFNITLTIIISFLFMIKIFLTKTNFKEMIVILFISLFVLVSSYKVDNYDLFLNFLAIVASKNVDIKKTIKLLLKINLIMLFIHLFYSLIIYFIEPSKLVYYLDDGIKRYTLFTRHPNYLGATFFWCLCGYIYTHFNSKKNYILIIIIGIFSYFINGSKTSLLAFFMLFLFLLLKKFLKVETLKKVVCCTYVILIIFSFFYMTNFYNAKYSNMLSKLDSYLTNRVRYSAIAYENYGITFFGNKINTNESTILNENYINKLIIDSFYVSCFVEYGCLYLVLILISIFKVKNRLDLKELIFLELFIIICFTERYTIYCILAFPLLFFGKIFERRIKPNENSIFD